MCSCTCLALGYSLNFLQAETAARRFGGRMFLKVHGEGTLFKIDFSWKYGRLKFLDWNIWTPDLPSQDAAKSRRRPPASKLFV